MHIKKIALTGMALLLICLHGADAIAQAEVVLIKNNFAFRKGHIKGVEVEAVTVKGIVKNVGNHDAKNVSIVVDCRGCYPQFDSNVSTDQWGQITRHYAIKYVSAGEKEEFQFVVAARRRGNHKPSVPQGMSLQVQGWE
jgi:hypothetical protein